MKAHRGMRKSVYLAVVLIALALVSWAILWRGNALGSAADRHVAAGTEFFLVGQADRAEQEWRQALKTDPKNADAWELLGERYRKANDWPAAREAYLQLQNLRPESLDVRIHLADCALHLGDGRAALLHTQTVLEKEPKNVAALRLAVTLMASSFAEKQRLDYLKRLAALEPEDRKTALSLAVELEAQTQYTEAIPVLDSLLQKEPNNVQALSLRGVCLYKEGASTNGLAKAEADLRRALELSPNAPYPSFHLGKIYNQMGKRKEAIPLLEQAAQQMPDNPEIYYALAESYQKTGEAAKAAAARSRFQALQQENTLIDTLEKRCEVDPNHFENHLQVGRLLLKKGKTTRAKYYLDRAKALRPNDPQWKNL